MAIFLGNANSGDQNFLHMLIYHGDTSYYTFFEKIGANPSGKFAPILTDTPVNYLTKKLTLLFPSEAAENLYPSNSICRNLRLDHIAFIVASEW